MGPLFPSAASPPPGLRFSWDLEVWASDNCLSEATWYSRAPSRSSECLEVAELYNQVRSTLTATRISKIMLQGGNHSMAFQQDEFRAATAILYVYSSPAACSVMAATGVGGYRRYLTGRYPDCVRLVRPLSYVAFDLVGALAHRQIVSGCDAEQSRAS